jgi:hypothetical protein
VSSSDVDDLEIVITTNISVLTGTVKDHNGEGSVQGYGPAG